MLDDIDGILDQMEVRRQALARYGDPRKRRTQRRCLVPLSIDDQIDEGCNIEDRKGPGQQEVISDLTRAWQRGWVR